ncbi:MAG: hypothetical protein F6J94_09880 [Moorea sp. SIO1F2]|uniref:hypothetical protein n=1 Tax=unclassified Moorena TaxID=2683338 RepID=UPI0013B89856|nr:MULTISPECIES: hypothetical protein [unclassified Moorena]NEN98059.1 hypothetical protein [Moorena sp. SIO3I7]NEO06505.1 hypothetical protein [Moorena sp. SIO3I8]NEO63093.1 hypothetical protein [Moorena sp. SIO4G2]NET82232.1 hypothetical protein [Moorena sp. SIO1F2]
MILVIVINILLSLLCLYIACQVWRLGQWLSSIANRLERLERRIYNNLYSAPKAIVLGQVGIHGLREQYQKLQLQLHTLKQIFLLLGMLQKFGGFRWRFSYKPTSKNSLVPRERSH